jgi:hypothetical protein
MAKKVITQLIDDLTGEPVEDGESIQFTWLGQPYEIDLGKDNADEFREIMDKYVEAAAELQPEPLVPAPRRTRSSSGSKGGAGRSKEELAAIRAWLKENGHDVAERGRIKGELIELYDAAHK